MNSEPNASLFALLRALDARSITSSAQLAQRLNLDAAAVAALAHQARELGAQIEVSPQGYRLSAPLGWLDAQRVYALLGASAARVKLEIVDCVDSTNSMLMQRATGSSSGACIAAEWQYQGRGRRGRAWRGSLGGSLTFSLLWQFDGGAGALAGLSLAVGVALVRALRQLGIDEVKLKWPNDVVYQHHKLAGVLVELVGDVLGPTAIIIGVGLNVRVSLQAREAIDQAVTDLSAILGAEVDRNRVLAALLDHLVAVLRQYENLGFSAFLDEWTQHHAYHWREVRLQLPNGVSETGRVVGVLADGSLSIMTPSGAKNFTVGEISLRGR